MDAPSPASTFGRSARGRTTTLWGKKRGTPFEQDTTAAVPEGAEPQGFLAVTCLKSTVGYAWFRAADATIRCGESLGADVGSAAAAAGPISAARLALGDTGDAAESEANPKGPAGAVVLMACPPSLPDTVSDAIRAELGLDQPAPRPGSTPTGSPGDAPGGSPAAAATNATSPPRVSLVTLQAGAFKPEAGRRVLQAMHPTRTDEEWAARLPLGATAASSAALAAVAGLAALLQRYRVSAVEVEHAPLGSCVAVSRQALHGLQVFRLDEHPAAFQGVGAAKEGLSLFGFVDRCVTPAGRRTLRSWLCCPTADRRVLEGRWAALRLLTSPKTVAYSATLPCGDTSHDQAQPHNSDPRRARRYHRSGTVQGQDVTVALRRSVRRVASVADLRKAFGAVRNGTASAGHWMSMLATAQGLKQMANAALPLAEFEGREATSGGVCPAPLLGTTFLAACDAAAFDKCTQLIAGSIDFAAADAAAATPADAAPRDVGVTTVLGPRCRGRRRSSPTPSTAQVGGTSTASRLGSAFASGRVRAASASPSWLSVARSAGIPPGGPPPPLGERQLHATRQQSQRHFMTELQRIIGGRSASRPRHPSVGPLGGTAGIVAGVLHRRDKGQQQNQQPAGDGQPRRAETRQTTGAGGQFTAARARRAATVAVKAGVDPELDEFRTAAASLDTFLATAAQKIADAMPLPDAYYFTAPMWGRADDDGQAPGGPLVPLPMLRGAGGGQQGPRQGGGLHSLRNLQQAFLAHHPPDHTVTCAFFPGVGFVAGLPRLGAAAADQRRVLHEEALKDIRAAALRGPRRPPPFEGADSDDEDNMVFRDLASDAELRSDDNDNDDGEEEGADPAALEGVAALYATAQRCDWTVPPAPEGWTLVPDLAPLATAAPPAHRFGDPLPAAGGADGGLVFFRTQETELLDDRVGDLQQAATDLEVAALCAVEDAVLGFEAALVAAARHAPSLDCVASLAVVAVENGWTQPEVLFDAPSTPPVGGAHPFAQRHLRLRKARHPFLALSLQSAAAARSQAAVAAVPVDPDPSEGKHPQHRSPRLPTTHSRSPQPGDASLHSPLAAVLEMAQRKRRREGPTDDATVSSATHLDPHPRRAAVSAAFVPPTAPAAPQQVIPFDFEALPGAVVVTGPNAAGKSVMLRTVALVVLLAHAGSYVPCDSAVVPVVDAVYVNSAHSAASAAPSATLRSGFGAEAATVSHALRTGFAPPPGPTPADEIGAAPGPVLVPRAEGHAAPPPHRVTSKSLLILDEFGNGTAPSDGAAVLAAIVAETVAAVTASYHRLGRQTPCGPGPAPVFGGILLVATHFGPALRRCLGTVGAGHRSCSGGAVLPPAATGDDGVLCRHPALRWVAMNVRVGPGGRSVFLYDPVPDSVAVKSNATVVTRAAGLLPAVQRRMEELLSVLSPPPPRGFQSPPWSPPALLRGPAPAQPRYHTAIVRPPASKALHRVVASVVDWAAQAPAEPELVRDTCRIRPPPELLQLLADATAAAVAAMCPGPKDAVRRAAESMAAGCVLGGARVKGRGGRVSERAVVDMVLAAERAVTETWSRELRRLAEASVSPQVAATLELQPGLVARHKDLFLLASFLRTMCAVAALLQTGGDADALLAALPPECAGHLHELVALFLLKNAGALAAASPPTTRQASCSTEMAVSAPSGITAAG